MKTVPEPWKSFFAAIDETLAEETHLEILGGFVVVILYNAPRTTAHVDVVSVTPNTQTRNLIEIAGTGSMLHKKHGVYIDRVGIATLPENYEDRLQEIFAGEFQNLRLFALDPYDIALAKIERNIPRDREDVKFLASTVPFDLKTLEERYFKELRPVLGNPAREDLTLKL
ncbi:MAG: DUF6036 family nucleotidyltransferase [Acidobacteriota bacterium]|nr:DUF6036 family nucleotidyltransferase [Acidobacteriota bacterium]